MTDTALSSLLQISKSPGVRVSSVQWHNTVALPQYPWILHPQIQPTTGQLSTVCVHSANSAAPRTTAHQAPLSIELDVNDYFLLPNIKRGLSVVGDFERKLTVSSYILYCLETIKIRFSSQPLQGKQFLPEGRVEGTLTFKAVEFTFLLETGYSRMQQSVTLFSMSCRS